MRGCLRKECMVAPRRRHMFAMPLLFGQSFAITDGEGVVLDATGCLVEAKGQNLYNRIRSWGNQMTASISLEINTDGQDEDPMWPRTVVIAYSGKVLLSNLHALGNGQSISGQLPMNQHFDDEDEQTFVTLQVPPKMGSISAE